MPSLDPRRAYVLEGTKGEELEEKGEAADEVKHPTVLHLKLSASVLEAIITSQRGENPARLTSLEGDDPLLIVNEDQHSLRCSAESNPHMLYSYQANSTTLQRVGSVSNKLSIGSEVHNSSSATTRLKERLELEEARKTEHRTVLINSALPSTRSRPSASTSKLKLRAKGLVPASTNSPLIRSRAGTPIEANSLPGSPNLTATTQRPAKTPPATTVALLSQQSSSIKSSPLGYPSAKVSPPPTKRKQLIQLLASGPISRRNVVQQLQHPESSVLTLLSQTAQVAPDHLQPKVETPKKFSGPVNRRSSIQVQTPTSSQSGERGPNTLYILKDELYSQVSIKECADYSSKEKQAVSEHMEAAFRRLGFAKEAEEWKKLSPDSGLTTEDDKNSVGDSDGGREPRTEDEAVNDVTTKKRLSLSSSSMGSPSKADGRDEIVSGKQPVKKNSTMDRLKKAAKGKPSSRPSTPTTTTKALPAKKGKSNDATEGKSNAIADKDEAPSSKSEAANPASSKTATSTTTSKAIKTTKAPPSKSSSKPKTSSTSKVINRKKYEYTDSSDDGEMQLDNLPLQAESTKKLAPEKKKSNHAPAHKSSSSNSPDEKKVRHGVGSGAAFTSEPWLEVRSRGDWKRLAERFKRVYEEFLTGRSRLQEEESLIRAELEQARLEPKESVNTSKEVIMQDDNGLQIDEEREEGEATPTEGTGKGILSIDTDPTSFANVAWRSSGKDKRTTSKPMSFEELETHISKLKETEAQLTRMKGALQTSKKTLEASTA